jgi:hypothetical protein
MPFDIFEPALDSLIAPARNAFSVTPDDTNALASLPKAIYVGTGGNITLRGVDSTQDVIFYNVSNGSIIDIRAKFIRATGTTASNLIGLA